MSRQPVEETVVGLKTIVQPLPFDRAQPLIPEVMQIISIAGAEIAPLLKSGALSMKSDVMKLSPVIGKLGKYFENGKLEWLAARMLFSTEVHADGERFELMKDQDRLNLFNAHPESYFPLLFQAGRITFARFFPASVLRAAATPSPST